MWWAVTIAQHGDVVSAEITDVDNFSLQALGDHRPRGEIGAVAVTDCVKKRQLLLGFFLVKSSESVLANLAV